VLPCALPLVESDRVNLISRVSSCGVCVSGLLSGRSDLQIYVGVRGGKHRQANVCFGVVDVDALLKVRQQHAACAQGPCYAGEPPTSSQS
jgi:hypothetical protein